MVRLDNSYTFYNSILHKGSFDADSLSLPKEYDICIITAANDYQALGYEKQISWRKERKYLPAETDFLVYSDPQGKRIGSGGSTIYVLYKLLEYFFNNGKNILTENPFKKKRILILHSGGDSKRLPAYSPQGKLFTPLPVNSYTDGLVTLFDILYANLRQLPALDEGQVVVASGDVLLSFDPNQIAFSMSGLTGLAYPGPVEIASKHGVYIPFSDYSRESLREVADFLQKPDYDELTRLNGLDADNRAFIDTGILNFSIDAIKTLMDASGISLENQELSISKDGLCSKLINGEVQLDIYKEIPFAILGKEINETLDALRQIPFSVCLLPNCEFFHVGQSKQMLQNMYTINYTASAYKFQNFSKSIALNKNKIEEAFVYNSIIDTDSISLDGPCLIEGCYLQGNIMLEGENILTGVPKGSGDIKLQRGLCMTCIPVCNKEKMEKGWATIIYGIEDDFKGSIEDGNITFLNEDFIGWMKDKGIDSSEFWYDDEPQDLWNAHLFPYNEDPAKSINILHDGIQFDAWRTCHLMSMKEILESVDYERLLENYSYLCRKVNLQNLSTIEISQIPSDEFLVWCQDQEDYISALENILRAIKDSSDTLHQSHLHKLISSILRKAVKKRLTLAHIYDKLSKILSNVVEKPLDIANDSEAPLLSLSESFEDCSFKLIREAIGKNLTRDHRPQKIRIRSDEVVWVCAPIRLDFAGGWTDTPPYCLEHGGSVLNAAVKLNGQYPVQVIGKIFPEPFIKINSIDLGQSIIIHETAEMLSYQDPNSWLALPKAAFAVNGIIPEGKQGELQDIMKELGGGIDLTLFSAVPSGSGLGTSSILGSAIIMCLSRMLGQELTQEELFNRTLYMEQLMTTGGGWQDQIGGVVGGVKHIQTEPGLIQNPKISWTDLRARFDMNLSERFLLYYTGYRRMAKNILRSIVGKYLDRDMTTIQVLERLRNISLQMKDHLDHRDIDAFGKKIAEVWELNKTLDPGTSNDDIEAILDNINNLCYGAKLLGAGGGGFLFIVSKGIEQTQEIKRILNENPPNDRARFFDFDIDPEGLKVSVL